MSYKERSNNNTKNMIKNYAMSMGVADQKVVGNAFQLFSSMNVIMRGNTRKYVMIDCLMKALDDIDNQIIIHIII